MQYPMRSRTARIVADNIQQEQSNCFVLTATLRPRPVILVTVVEKNSNSVLVLSGSAASRYYHPCATTTLNKPNPSTAYRDAGNTSPILYIRRMEHPTHPTHMQHQAPSKRQTRKNKHTARQQASSTIQVLNVLARARRQSPRSRPNAWSAGRKTGGTIQKKGGHTAQTQPHQ